MKNNIIFLFIRKHKFSYLIGILFILTSSYIQTLFPKVLGQVIDILKSENFDLGLVKINIILILLIAIGTFISTSTWRNLVIGNGRKLECHLREVLFNHLQTLSSEFYSKRKTGDLIAYSINDVSAIRMTFGPATALSINGIVLLIASIYSMCRTINWQLTLIALLPIPFIVVIMLGIGKIIHVRFRKIQENFAAISDRIQENIYGIRVIKTYVQEEAELKNFEILNNKMMESNLSMVKISSLLSPIIEVCFSLSFVSSLIIGGNMVLKGTISLGNFVAFNTYLTMIMRPVISIGRIINIFQRGLASLKRLNDILDVEPAIKDGLRAIKIPIKGEIEYKNFSFNYPGSENMVLKNINIKILKGHTLGIVGRTGSGKSTLANILLKLYNIETDSVFLDEIDLMDYSLETLRESIGYVSQENFLFSASIKDNITFFKDGYSDEQVMESAKNSCIEQSITSLPKGFSTILGERGVNLSGGQKQRICISRSLIKNPNILILDDALSAVDSVTEEEILKNLKALRKDKTSIIISHKISTVINADEIIVLEKGEIVERGTHQQLLKEGGIYFDIFQEQFKDNHQGSNYQAS